MKRIILVVLVLLISNISFSQIKQRSSSITHYLGIGYKFVFLTNQAARDAYPFFQLSNGDFMKEIDGFLGVNINEKYAIELAPSYLFTNSLNSDGYYFNNSSGNRFYAPTQSRLFAVPLSLKFKFFPFAKNYASSISKLYFMAGGGGMYINEEIAAQIYLDESEVTFLGARTFENSFWTGNYEFAVGISSFSKIGYGFELSYRLVPITNQSNIPVITSVAKNFNSINFTANIVFTF
ncbi:MAG: hypothetical protein M3R36_01505 [Bacteroidota bacterium]|nr:hypothetical protein [Bacteroidota bacterium]